jgi:hypothetical protein
MARAGALICVILIKEMHKNGRAEAAALSAQMALAWNCSESPL